MNVESPAHISILSSKGDWVYDDQQSEIISCILRPSQHSYVAGQSSRRKFWFVFPVADNFRIIHIQDTERIWDLP